MNFNEQKISGLEEGGVLFNYPFTLAVERGLVPKHSILRKFGRNADVDSGTTPEDLWSRGGLWVAPTVPRVHDIASTAPGSDNGKTVRVFGNDENGLPVSEDVLVGASTTKTYRVIYRMFNPGATAFVGTITATAQVDGTVTAEIPIGSGQTLMAIYEVPSNHDLFLINWWGSMNKAGVATQAAEADLSLRVTNEAGTVYLTKKTQGTLTSGSSDFDYPLKFEKIPADSRVEIHINQVSSNDIDFDGGFDGVLVTH